VYKIKRKQSEPRRDASRGRNWGGRESTEGKNKKQKKGTMGVDAGRVEAAMRRFVLYKNTKMK